MDLPALETPSPVLMPNQLLSSPIALHFEEALPLTGIMPASINVSVNLHQPSTYGLSGPPDPVFLDDSMESGEREITITRNPYFDPSLSPGPADDFLTLASFESHVGNFHFGLDEPPTWTQQLPATSSLTQNRDVSFASSPVGDVRRKRPSTTQLQHDANCAASKLKKPDDTEEVNGNPTPGPSGQQASRSSNAPGRSGDDGPIADDLQLECLTDGSINSSTEDEESDDDDDSCIEVVTVRKVASRPPEVVDLTVSEDEAPAEGKHSYRP